MIFSMPLAAERRTEAATEVSLFSVLFLEKEVAIPN